MDPQIHNKLKKVIAQNLHTAGAVEQDLRSGAGEFPCDLLKSCGGTSRA
jgi:hypothetical protein